MRLKLLMLALVVATPALGWDHRLEVIARATWIDSTSESLDFDRGEEDFGLEFDDEIGFGLAVNFFLTRRISLEVGASIIEPDFIVVLDDEEGPRGTEGLEMIPITAALQFHPFGSGRFDPYVGAGGTWIIFDDVNELSDLAENDVERIEFGDEGGWMVNAGLNIGIFRSLALNLDAKYSEIEPEGSVTFLRGDFTATRNVEFSPLLVSAGVRWSF